MDTTPHESLDTWLTSALADLPGPCARSAQEARARQATLTKPPGSLGRLEDISIWLAGWQGRCLPRLERVNALIFAGNHGVVEEGISAFPPEVTGQMIANFQAGGAAISCQCAALDIDLAIHPIEIDRPSGNIAKVPAMTAKECADAFFLGVNAVPQGCDALLLGEMGIGNTTIAAALAAASLGGDGATWAGPGTGLPVEGVAKKAKVIDRALALHQGALGSPVEIMRCLGGCELVAIAGAVVGARRQRIPVILDGFVVGAAIVPLVQMNRDILAHCVAGHVSAEPGHRRLLDEMSLDPLLDLGMRLGEGSGAALAVGVLRSAVAVHNGMATFAEAGVAKKND